MLGPHLPKVVGLAESVGRNRMFLEWEAGEAGPL